MKKIIYTIIRIALRNAANLGTVANVNCGYLKIGERRPIWQISNMITEENGQMRLV